MLSLLKRFFAKGSPQEQRVAAQPPGVIFPWPEHTKLTAMEEVVIAIPLELFGKEETIGSVICSDPHVEINIPPKGHDAPVLLRLKSGLSVSLTKSCQAMIVADDKRPRRLKVGVPNKR